MYTDMYFKSLFEVDKSNVKADLISLLDVADLNVLLNWSELNLTKRPNVIENTSLYGFIKRDLRPSGFFQSDYDPKYVSLTLLAFQGFYESLLRRSATVLFEATKAKFKDSEWYGAEFKNKEKNYKTAEMISFVNNCLTAAKLNSETFVALSEVMKKIHLNRLNKIRNAVAHNMFVVEGNSEENSVVCYSESDSRSYFVKEEYKTIKTSDLFKMLDMMDLFRELFLASLVEASQKLPNYKMLFCVCGMQAFGDPQDSTKKCYFCGETGKFRAGEVSITAYLPPLPR